MSKSLSANDQAVQKLADELWKEMLAASPIWGTFLGIEVNDGALDDNSDAARLRDRAMWEKYGKAAGAIGDSLAGIAISPSSCAMRRSVEILEATRPRFSASVTRSI